ncbi:LrgB family protein [Pontibacillus sp. HMF3514]|uniref:LrgB family protein n=1 Tax=Pontibacillus sp. HMF3514 TaxID=2692425 RepID=UPI00131FEB8C|nr:LrgB family protein [Pontibacillus sp. HMF3514]QHE51709.1 LrgB family protein [Pontibacillus sp. HMF3514]
MSILIGIITFISTVLIYLASRKLYQKVPNPFLLPVLPSTAFLVAILLIFHIPYETYMVGGKWIDWFLGPGVVALAYPLYKNWEILKRYSVSILIGVFVGAVIGVSTGLLLAKWVSFDEAIIYSIIPKNSTTPIAMEVATTLGGVSSMAAVFVMIAGIGGAILGPFVLKWSGIHHFLGRGIGFGSASHAIGTSKAMENSEQEGAISTVAMTVSAIMVSIVSPILVYFLY